MPNETYYQKKQIAETAEGMRLRISKQELLRWRHWGPYLSERQWGTVREWYDASKNPWTDFVHDQARSRAYRWGEDGILGISDLQQLLCFSVALWNGKDPILKERLFGLTNAEGNHGEDVKEYYFYLDNLPSHAYMKGLYRYPYEYPYNDLVSKARSMGTMEYELIHTGKLDNSAYVDVFVEYAKADEEDILIRITVVNQGAEEKAIDVLPTIWYRNTWSWNQPLPPPPAPEVVPGAPTLSVDGGSNGTTACIHASPATDPATTNVVLSERFLYCEGSPELLFTNNETNVVGHLEWNHAKYTKDGINNYVVNKEGTAVNPQRKGSKAAAHYHIVLKPGEQRVITLRLTNRRSDQPFGPAFEAVFDTREAEADAFYDALCPYKRLGGTEREADLARVQRQAFAGMLWSKQFYYLVAHRWLLGDKGTPPSWDHQNDGKLKPWEHLYCKDVLSMPDTWEYPWFAAWDLAFHTTTFAYIDPAFAKHQLELLVMEWFQHPNGQIPAYEWDFSNINPPVHAWAAWRVYETEKALYGTGDEKFLERVFGKLNMNFTWWVNKVDPHGKNLFQGGFLGMDNIRIVDRDPSGQPIEQADGTAWVAMFCLNMVKMATELTRLHRTSDDAYPYKDATRKYLQHFMYLCRAMNTIGKDGLWDDNDGFFMDCANQFGRLRVFSMVGLVPLFAVENLDVELTGSNSFYDVDGFLSWFARHRGDLVAENDVINLDGLLGAVAARARTPADLPAKQPIGNRPPSPALETGVQLFTTSTPTSADVQAFRAASPTIEVAPTVKASVAILDKTKLGRVLAHMLDSSQFLSPHGVRSLSLYHLDNTRVPLNNGSLEVRYEPAESVAMVRMGGNSNWCGPVWMPMNYMIVDSLRKFHSMLSSTFTVEYPPKSGSAQTLDQVADDLSWRLIKIFLRDPGNGNRRPVFGGEETFQSDPKWKDYILFYEYFHGGGNGEDTWAGAGLGASHQTGWTGLVANLIQDMGVRDWNRGRG